jgi:hypothetical protein
MFKRLLVFSVLASLALIAVPAIASDNAKASGADLDYISGVRSAYMDQIDHQGQTMIFDDIELVKEGSSYSFPLTVGTGDYEIWGIGGRGIQHLKVSIYSANRDLLAESTDTENLAALSFSEPVSRSHRVEVVGSGFDSGINEGYFLVIVIRK